jgi:hypothetical protein
VGVVTGKKLPERQLDITSGSSSACRASKHLRSVSLEICCLMECCLWLSQAMMSSDLWSRQVPFAKPRDPGGASPSPFPRTTAGRDQFGKSKQKWRPSCILQTSCSRHLGSFGFINQQVQKRITTTGKMSSAAPEKDKSKTHKLSLKGSAKLVAEFVSLNPNNPTPTNDASQHANPHPFHPVPILHPHDPVRPKPFPRQYHPSGPCANTPKASSAASTPPRTSPPLRNMASTC